MAEILVEIRAEAFDPWGELGHWNDDSAAVAVFVGRVRATAMDGRPLQALELEHFPGLCERQIRGMAEQQQLDHGAGAMLVLHRVGRLVPGEPIVLVAVQADRRGGAALIGSLVVATQAPGPVLEAGVVRWSGHLVGGQHATLIEGWMLQPVAQLFEPGVADASAG